MLDYNDDFFVFGFHNLAITNDMMNEQHSKQLDAEDSDEGEIDDDDSSSNSYQSETQGNKRLFFVVSCILVHLQ